MKSSRLWLSAGATMACLVLGGVSLADVTTLGGNNTKLRLRVGDNNFNSVQTSIFEVPGAMLGDGSPVASANNTGGGSGAFTVRFVIDTRRYPGNAGPLPLNGQGSISGNSSAPMTCITPATCGANSIPFDTISWDQLDGDVLGLASSFNNGANQLLHTHTITPLSPAPPRQGWRYRDRIQFVYDNNLFLPAGNYRGTVTYTADYQ